MLYFLRRFTDWTEQNYVGIGIFGTIMNTFRIVMGFTALEACSDFSASGLSISEGQILVLYLIGKKNIQNESCRNYIFKAKIFSRYRSNIHALQGGRNHSPDQDRKSKRIGVLFSTFSGVSEISVRKNIQENKGLHCICLVAFWNILLLHL